MADQFGDAQHALGRLAGVAVMGSRHQSSTPETSRLVRRLEGGSPHRIMIRLGERHAHMMMQVRADLAPPPGACARIIGRDRRRRDIRLFHAQNKMASAKCLTE
jgi:hypothetical protein